MKTIIIAILLAANVMAVNAQSINDIDGSPITQAKAEAILRNAEDTALCDPNILLALDHGAMPYEFAKTVMVSLYDMHAAIQDGLEPLADAKKDPNSNPFATLGAMMTGTKLAMGDHACARRIVNNFIRKKPAMKPAGSDPKWIEDQKSGIETAAGLLSTAYYTQLMIDMRALQLLNRFGSPRVGDSKDFQSDMTQMMNQLSSLQVDAGKIPAGLLSPTMTALIFLCDDLANRDGKLDRISITRAQRQHLFDWLNEHFPGLQTEPEEKLDGFAQKAKLYFALLKFKCADEN